MFLDKWERKFGWLSFPGLLRYYALFHVAVFLLAYFNPMIAFELDFDLERILAGEVWRVISFLFATSGLEGWPLPVQALFLYFMVNIASMVSDGLEGAWGVFRTSLFLYVGYAGLVISNMVFSLLFYHAFSVMISVPFTGLILYTSAFLAFATLFPKVELMVFLVLPIQVRWLALLALIPMIQLAFMIPLSIPYMVLVFSNYLLWAGIPAMRGKKQAVKFMAKSVARRRKFENSKLDEGEAFHRCKSCARTEVSDPELEFRMAADGEEYCEDHLRT